MSEPEQKKDNRAEKQARSGVENIAAMMRRLNHARECDGESEGTVADCGGPGDCGQNECECECHEPCVSDREIIEANGYHYDGGSPSEEAREEYHDEDKAQQAVDESHYGIQVRGQWASPGDIGTLSDPIEYAITLSGGGPATRIYGELGPGNVPETADMQYQDWFTPWEDLFIEDNEIEELLLEYAQQFYYGN